MTEHTIDEVHLKRLIQKAAGCFEMARTCEEDGNKYMGDIQRLMDFAGKDRVEWEGFPYIIARPKKGTRVRLEKKL